MFNNSNSPIQLLSLLMLTLLSSVCYANDLAIGNSSKTATGINIEILPQVDFPPNSLATILSWRNQQIMKYSYLMNGAYIPDNNVFGNVESRCPWWGTLGEAYYGAGQKSIAGPAVQSKDILNPYLLATVQGTPTLPKNFITETELLTKSYPTYFPVTGLHWWPKEGRGEVTYLISSYEYMMSSLFGYKNFKVHAFGGLELINARDLGLNYVFIPPASASNIKLNNPMAVIMPIPQYLHCGGSCGYPGGCNNMSPATDWLDNMEITNLPAQVKLMFWKSMPSSSNTPPDMIFFVNFQ